MKAKTLLPMLALFMSLWQGAKGRLTEFKENSKGEGEVVMAVIVILVMVAVGALVVYAVLNALQQTSTDNSTNATIANIRTTSQTVFNLLVVLAIVVTASAIIGVVYYAFRGGGGGGIAPPPGGY